MGFQWKIHAGVTSAESDDLAQLTKQGSSYVLFSLRLRRNDEGTDARRVRVCVVRCRQ